MPDPNEPLAGGGLLGTNHLQQSIDSLKGTIDKLNTGLSQVVPQLRTTSRMMAAGGAGGFGAGAYPTGLFWGNNGGHGPHGGQQKAQAANGGGATFGGQQRGSGGPAGGAGGQTSGGQAGGGRVQQLLQPFGGKAGAAVLGGAALGRGLMNVAGQYGGTQLADQLVMSQLSMGGATTPGAVKQALRGDYTAMNAADSAQALYTMGRGLGVQAGTGAQRRISAAIGSATAMNPGISNLEVAQVTTAINQPKSTMMLRGFGIASAQAGRPLDTLSLARQILQRIRGNERIKTSEDITAAIDNPNGPVAVTIRAYIANGLLPPESEEIVKEHIRALLIARQKNLGFSDYQQLLNQAQSGNKGAQDKLKELGVADASAVSEIRAQQSRKRDVSLTTTEGFASGVTKATEIIGVFTSAIEKFLDQTGLGTAVGWVAGAKSGFGGNASDMGAMMTGGTAGYVGTPGGWGGTPDDKLSRSTSGTPSTGTTRPTGSNAPSGKPGTQSGQGRTSGSGGKMLKFIKPVGGRISSPYGMRKHPISGQTKMHTGIDFAASSGTPIHAAAGGRVTFSGSGGGNGWAGNYVKIDHGGGVSTMYAHQSRTAVKVGTTVQQGQVIGYVGSTGRSTGPHLHFEIHINGRPVNPAPYLKGAGLAVDSTTPTAESSTATSTGTQTAETTTPDMSPVMSSVSGNPSVSEREALQSFAVTAGNSGLTSTSATETSSTTGSSSSSNGSDVDPNVKAAPSNATGNVALGKKMAAAVGWAGREWDALYDLWMKESGWRSNADNPTSSAYGIPQALTRLHFKDATKRRRYMTDPAYQIAWGIDYIKGAYGTPSRALSKWRSRSPHWYEDGAWSIDRDQEAVVHKDEMIVPAKEARQIREILLNGTAYGAARPQVAGSGLQITIEKGAVEIHTSAGVSSAGVADLGKAFADALAENEKIKRLQEGVLT